MVDSVNLSLIKNAQHRQTVLDIGSMVAEGPIASLMPPKPRYEVRERSVGYQFFPHFHPYTNRLMQELLTGGVDALQDVDTQNAAAGTSRPFSIEVRAGDGGQLVVHAQSWIAVIATINDGVTTIEQGAQLRVLAEVAVRIPSHQELQAASGIGLFTLNAGMEQTPDAGQTLPLDVNREATLRVNSIFVTTAAVAIRLPNDAQVTLPSGTPILTFASMQVTIPAATELVVERYRPRPALYRDLFGADQAKPMVDRPYPVADLDFTSRGAYSVYNWEVFFHAPLTIAMHLSKNQRYAEAQAWLHYIFDPTDDSGGPTPERYWKFRPFTETDVMRVETLLTNLVSLQDQELAEATTDAIHRWMNAPFRPHNVARNRHQAYMYKTVMAYLDNLIAWGDSLFCQDTGEAIDEAMMLYVLAAQILGVRPQPAPRKGSVRPQTYASLRNDLAAFGSALRAVQPDLLFNLLPAPPPSSGNQAQLAMVDSLGRSLYFCVPPNDNLLGYWDTVADRLFKIRNSLNIQGVYRQLALFEPPIDPAMLVRATAAGVDIASVVAGVNQPMPLVRFQLLVQKAFELSQEVKALGANLLAAMEKEDGEALTLLRTRHERDLQQTVERTRYAQLHEATKNKQALYLSLAQATQRFLYFERQLGRPAAEALQAIPLMQPLDLQTLADLKFQSDEPLVTTRDLPIDIARDLGASGGHVISSHEASELALLSDAQQIQTALQGIQIIGQQMAMLPEFVVQMSPMGAGTQIHLGSVQFAKFQEFLSTALGAIAQQLTYAAGNAGRIGGFARRELEWAYQSNQAAGEITQIFKQIRAAEIREAVADFELQAHRKQMAQSADVEFFLNGEDANKTGKKTNKALYAWMKREVMGLHNRSFQFALETAKKAERALQLELGNPNAIFIGYGYQSGKEGLLAGEKLALDIKRMEMAFHDLNQREYELTRHISLLQIAPEQLVLLRATGNCEFSIPEELFDLDGPGQYFRRIKSVALSIPAVTGPYTGVNCRLTLTRSSVRISPNPGDSYTRLPEDDERFSDSFGRTQSIVTSSGVNDSGLFETNLRDERVLPFEYAGAISTWALQLPGDPTDDAQMPPAWDYRMATDVIMHMRLTAREGGKSLRDEAAKHFNELLTAPEGSEPVLRRRLFAIHDEFPMEWAKLGSDADELHPLALKLRPEHYPFWAQRSIPKATITKVSLFARYLNNDDPTLPKFGVGNNSPSFSKDAAVGELARFELENVDLPAITDENGEPPQLSVQPKGLQGLWMLVEWEMQA